MLFTDKIILLSKKRKRSLYNIIIFPKHDIQSMDICLQLQIYILSNSESITLLFSVLIRSYKRAIFAGTPEFADTHNVFVHYMLINLILIFTAALMMYVQAFSSISNWSTLNPFYSQFPKVKFSVKHRISVRIGYYQNKWKTDTSYTCHLYDFCPSRVRALPLGVAVEQSVMKFFTEFKSQKK